jgi:hypothetical protein
MLFGGGCRRGDGKRKCAGNKKTAQTFGHI